jgi:hypothetical protein
VFGNQEQEGEMLIPATKFQNNFNNQPPPEQMMGKTKIMNEIQEQVKKNFDTELDKLRKEMNSRQSQLREQMEGLKAEAEKAMRERNEANGELKRMKELLDKKKEQEGYQQNLNSAVNKYAPSGSQDDIPQQRAASRGGVDLNNYEKMFFNNKNKDIGLAGKSLRGESALLPVDHNDTITNYFNKGNVKRQEETFITDKSDYASYEKSPEAMKKHLGYDMNDGNPYNANVEIPTLNSEIKNRIKREKVKYEYGSESESKSTNKNEDTFDFINKINGVGGMKSDKNKFGRQESLSRKVEDIRSRKMNDTGFTANEGNMALNIDNFPALPDYEGIQSNFMQGHGRGGNNYKADLNQSQVSNASPFKMTGMGGGGQRDSTNGFGNQTTNTMKTLNSVNLEKINNRNENRLMDIENKYNGNGNDNDDALSSLMNGNDYGYGDGGMQLDHNSNFMRGDEYLNSIKEERYEETLKKHKQL